MDPILRGEVRNGSLLLEKKAIEYLTRFTGEVQVIVRYPKKPKSEGQHKYYFGCMLKIISDETGNDVLEMHEYCKVMFLPIGHESTMTLNTKEAEDYYEQIRRHFAQEHDIYIPLPHEYDTNYST